MGHPELLELLELLEQFASRLNFVHIKPLKSTQREQKSFTHPLVSCYVGSGLYNFKPSSRGGSQRTARNIIHAEIIIVIRNEFKRLYA